MGTSKGYQPPTTPEWRRAKSSLTRYLKNTKDNRYRKKALDDYVKAHNSTSSYNGIALTGSKIADMFDFISREGFDKAINDLGLGELIGKSTEEVYNGIIDYFSNDTGDLEDSVIKDTISQLLIDYDISELYDLNNLTFDDFFLNFIVKYVQVDFKTIYYEKIMANRTPVESKEIIENINMYIEYSINDKYTAQELANINWKSVEGKVIIENKCRECYELLLAEEE
jgi:hypothetical protein